MDRAALERLGDAAPVQEFGSGDFLIRQGEEGRDLFVLAEGAVEVVVDSGGKELVVDHMEAGDYFGEMSLLTDEPRTASIRAITDGLLEVLSANLAARNLNRATKLEAAREAPAEEEKKGLAASLLEKMRRVFGGA